MDKDKAAGNIACSNGQYAAGTRLDVVCRRLQLLRLLLLQRFALLLTVHHLLATPSHHAADCMPPQTPVLSLPGARLYTD